MDSIADVQDLLQQLEGLNVLSADARDMKNAKKVLMNMAAISVSDWGGGFQHRVFSDIILKRVETLSVEESTEGLVKALIEVVMFGDIRCLDALEKAMGNGLVRTVPAFLYPMEGSIWVAVLSSWKKRNKLWYVGLVNFSARYMISGLHEAFIEYNEVEQMFSDRYVRESFFSSLAYFHMVNDDTGILEEWLVHMVSEMLSPETIRDRVALVYSVATKMVSSKRAFFALDAAVVRSGILEQDLDVSSDVSKGFAGLSVLEQVLAHSPIWYPINLLEDSGADNMMGVWWDLKGGAIQDRKVLERVSRTVEEKLGAAQSFDNARVLRLDGGYFVHVDVPGDRPEWHVGHRHALRDSVDCVGLGDDLDTVERVVRHFSIHTPRSFDEQVRGMYPLERALILGKSLLAIEMIPHSGDVNFHLPALGETTALEIAVASHNIEVISRVVFRVLRAEDVSFNLKSDEGGRYASGVGDFVDYLKAIVFPSDGWADNELPGLEDSKGLDVFSIMSARFPIKGMDTDLGFGKMLMLQMAEVLHMDLADFASPGWKDRTGPLHHRRVEADRKKVAKSHAVQEIFDTPPSSGQPSQQSRSVSSDRGSPSSRASIEESPEFQWNQIEIPSYQPIERVASSSESEEGDMEEVSEDDEDVGSGSEKRPRSDSSSSDDSSSDDSNSDDSNSDDNSRDDSSSDGQNVEYEDFDASPKKTPRDQFEITSYQQHERGKHVSRDSSDSSDLDEDPAVRVVNVERNASRRGDMLEVAASDVDSDSDDDFLNVSAFAVTPKVRKEGAAVSMASQESPIKSPVRFGLSPQKMLDGGHLTWNSTSAWNAQLRDMTVIMVNAFVPPYVVLNVEKNAESVVKGWEAAGHKRSRLQSVSQHKIVDSYSNTFLESAPRKKKVQRLNQEALQIAVEDVAISHFNRGSFRRMPRDRVRRPRTSVERLRDREIQMAYDHHTVSESATRLEKAKSELAGLGSGASKKKEDNITKRILKEEVYLENAEMQYRLKWPDDN